jgi:hypothetical protein
MLGGVPNVRYPYRVAPADIFGGRAISEVRESAAWRPNRSLAGQPGPTVEP